MFHELHSLCRKAYGSCESAILLFGTHIKSGEETEGLPAYSDTGFSDTPVTVTVLVCNCKRGALY